MNIFGLNLFYYRLIFGLGFNIQELTIFLVIGFINFGVTNQVPQVSFKIAAGDLISLHSFGSDMNLFGSDLFSNMIIFG